MGGGRVAMGSIVLHCFPAVIPPSSWRRDEAWIVQSGSSTSLDGQEDSALKVVADE